MRCDVGFLFPTRCPICGHALRLALTPDGPRWLCTLCGGWPDETLSSRAFRWSRDGLRHWPCLIIDRLFFWDTEKRNGLIVRHCQLSYESEQLRLQHPPELR